MKEFKRFLVNWNFKQQLKDLHIKNLPTPQWETKYKGIVAKGQNLEVHTRGFKLIFWKKAPSSLQEAKFTV
jgi:hypothetical protein